MDVRFALEIEIQVVKVRGELIDQVLIQPNIHDPFVPHEQVHPTGTLRAMQVTAVGRFDRKAGRISPLNNPAHYPRKKISGKKFYDVKNLGNQEKL
jgi:hypothetical protein